MRGEESKTSRSSRKRKSDRVGRTSSAERTGPAALVRARGGFDVLQRSQSASDEDDGSRSHTDDDDDDDGVVGGEKSIHKDDDAI